MKNVVGIVLVRNEDRFVRRAVSNISAFCDRIFLVDNGSTDRTVPILKALAGEDESKFSFHAIRHPRESHDLLKPYCGTDTWVFGVDGDEIYDPHGLKAVRSRLEAGDFDRHWMVMGNVLHCDVLERGRAGGYPAPPSRSITKLYNFAAIDSWDGETPERLHGGRPAFRAGFGESDKRLLFEEHPWSKSPLRCLHMCFLPRSSAEARTESRENIMETYCGGWTNLGRRLWRRLRGLPEASAWKRERYARGTRWEVDASAFFPGGGE